MVWGCFYSIFAPGRCVLSYPNDALSDDIDALISGANALSAAADSVGTISSGSDVLVSNFDHVEEVFDNLQAFLSELKSGHFYTPVGALMPFAGTSAYVPSGWLVCDGRSYAASGASVDLQSVLNAASFSALPDLQGRVAVGIGTNGDVNAVGDSDGITTVANRRPKHQHTAASVNNTTGITASGSVLIPAQTATSTGYNTNLLRYVDTTATLGGYNAGVAVSVSDPGHGHTVNVRPADYASVGTPTDVVPYLALNYIIKN